MKITNTEKQRCFIFHDADSGLGSEWTMVLMATSGGVTMNLSGGFAERHISIDLSTSDVKALGLAVAALEEELSKGPLSFTKNQVLGTVEAGRIELSWTSDGDPYEEFMCLDVYEPGVEYESVVYFRFNKRSVKDLVGALNKI